MQIGYVGENQNVSQTELQPNPEPGNDVAE